jgi:nitroreductase
MENIMIAAPAIGLGTVCIGGFDRRKVREQLEIPKDIEAVGMLYVGYPDEDKQPRTKYIEEAVHWGRYDGKRPREPRPGNILVFGPEASL